MPQDRVLAVRPFWETVSQEERVKLLSVSLEELKARAQELMARALKEQGAPCARRDSGRTFGGCVAIECGCFSKAHRLLAGHKSTCLKPHRWWSASPLRASNAADSTECMRCILATSEDRGVH